MTDRGTESSSGSLTGTSYTIDQLESTIIYTVTVRASNVAGTTDSQPITFSTGECVYIYLQVHMCDGSAHLSGCMANGYGCLLSYYYHSRYLLMAASDVCEAECVASTCPESVSSTCAESDNTAEIIGGVVVAVAFMIITALTVIVIVVLVLRTFRGNSKTRYIQLRNIQYYVHYICAGKGLMYLQLLTRQ